MVTSRELEIVRISKTSAPSLLKGLIAFFLINYSLYGFAALVEKKIEVEGLERTYLLYVPENLKKPAPIVFVFHGGGTAKSMLHVARFHQLADREGFIAVFPEAFRKHWNDGREDRNIPSHRKNIDDVKFVGAMLDAIGKSYGSEVIWEFFKRHVKVSI